MPKAKNFTCASPSLQRWCVCGTLKRHKESLPKIFVWWQSGPQLCSNSNQKHVMMNISSQYTLLPTLFRLKISLAKMKFLLPFLVPWDIWFQTFSCKLLSWMETTGISPFSLLLVEDHIKIMSDRNSDPNFKLQAEFSSLSRIQCNKIFGFMC